MKKATTAAEVLAFIKHRNHASENDVMHQFNPEPEFPIGGDEAARAVWRKAREEWMDETYGAASVATQLDKAGHIKTTNNGYNCYTYHFLKD